MLSLNNINTLDCCLMLRAWLVYPVACERLLLAAWQLAHVVLSLSILQFYTLPAIPYCRKRYCVTALLLAFTLCPTLYLLLLLLLERKILNTAIVLLLLLWLSSICCSLNCVLRFSSILTAHSTVLALFLGV